jgi:hypothetical protein
MTRNIGSTPGPTPGSTKAISQRKAVSEGYAVADDPSRVEMPGWAKTTTGRTKVPGLTDRKGRD